ncbi:uncharacterized protein LOC125942640 [Dermacentor silvarum]|uniref:uncharacterized protein LOC125942640 n=1 Tax=Dermacentor silvarum TaxID=543639 RepID=UPI0021015F02|nr:uncharacterized protein LOC125942640 [Dermacentor silvarum]
MTCQCSNYSRGRQQKNLDRLIAYGNGYCQLTSFILAAFPTRQCHIECRKNIRGDNTLCTALENSPQNSTRACEWVSISDECRFLIREPEVDPGQPPRRRAQQNMQKKRGSSLHTESILCGVVWRATRHTRQVTSLPCVAGVDSVWSRLKSRVEYETLPKNIKVVSLPCVAGVDSVWSRLENRAAVTHSVLTVKLFKLSVTPLVVRKKTAPSYDVTSRCLVTAGAGACSLRLTHGSAELPPAARYCACTVTSSWRVCAPSPCTVHSLCPTSPATSPPPAHYCACATSQT